MEQYSSMSIARVMMAISDKKSFYLLTKIAIAEVDSESLLSETKLSEGILL